MVREIGDWDRGGSFAPSPSPSPIHVGWRGSGGGARAPPEPALAGKPKALNVMKYSGIKYLVQIVIIVFRHVVNK